MAAVRLVTAVVAAALLALPIVSACADGDGAGAAATTVATGTPPASDPGGTSGIMLADSGLSVAEASALPAGGDPVAVRAYVIVAPDGSARLCDALAESSPPQCGGASLALTGLPDGFLTGLRSAQGVRWTDAPLQLIGRVRGDEFANDPEALVAG